MCVSGKASWWCLIVRSKHVKLYLLPRLICSYYGENYGKACHHIPFYRHSFTSPQKGGPARLGSVWLTRKANKYTQAQTWSYLLYPAGIASCRAVAQASDRTNERLLIISLHRAAAYRLLPGHTNRSTLLRNSPNATKYSKNFWRAWGLPVVSPRDP